MRTRTDAGCVAALVAATVAVWVLRVVHSARIMSIMRAGDLFGYFLPAYAYEADRLAGGALPLWNPYQGAGVPFLAMLQPGALYPARLLLLVLPPARAMGVSALCHVLLGVLGTYALCRRLGASAAGAVVGAVAFGTAFALPVITATTQLEPGAWLPVLALALVAIVDGGGTRWVLVLGVAGAMPALAGGYQMVVYTVYGLGLVALGLLADRRWRARVLAPRTLGRVAVAGLLAGATAAPQIAPTLAWTADAVRRTQSVSVLQAMPFVLESDQWQRIVAFFVRDRGLELAYLSIPVAALALVGFLAGGGLGAVAGASALGTAVLAVSRPGTLAFAVYRALPGFAMFRFPVRLVLLTVFFTAVTAAVGLTALARRAGATRGRVVIEAAALAIVIAVVVVPYRNEFYLPWVAPADLAGPEAQFFPTLAHLAGSDRVSVPGDRLGLRLGAFVRQGMRQRVRVLQDYDPLSARRLGVFLSAVAGVPPPADGATPAFAGLMLGEGARRIARPDLLDLVAVRAILAPDGAVDPAQAPGWRRVDTRAGLVTWANEGALPRAYVVERARFVPTEAAALAALVDGPDAGGVDPHREAVLVGEPDAGGPDAAVAPALAAGAAVPFVPTRVVRDEAEAIVLDVDVARPAAVVLADAFAPGWSVTVDGAPARVWQADYLVRAVLVPAGAHRVAFGYRAPGLLPGIAIAGTAWGVAAAAWLAGRRRRDGVTRPESRAPPAPARDTGFVDARGPVR